METVADQSTDAIVRQGGSELAQVRTRRLHPWRRGEANPAGLRVVFAGSCGPGNLDLISGPGIRVSSIVRPPRGDRHECRRALAPTPGQAGIALLERDAERQVIPVE
jgi:hypothetical protein